MKIGDKLMLLEDTEHGDWKTAIVFPNRWPMLKKGTIVFFQEIFVNCYGRYFTVLTKKGRSYDIPTTVLACAERPITKHHKRLRGQQ